jgi:GAF domain-containing protein
MPHPALKSNTYQLAAYLYFDLLSSKEIVVANHALESDQTSELLESYLKFYNIHSLMDIPIHIGGELVGVVCFENTEIDKYQTAVGTWFRPHDS